MKGFTGNSVVLIGGNIFSTETVTETTTLLTSVDYDSQIGDRVVIPAGTEVQVILPRETNPDYVRITARLDTEDELGKEVGGIIIASAIGNPTWIPLVAAFSWACVSVTQYDISGIGLAYATYDAIEINAVTYPFTQTYTVAIEAEYDAMIAEIVGILQGIDPDYKLVYASFVNGGAMTIFADAGIGISMISGVNVEALSEFNGADYLVVYNDSTGTYDTVTWDVDGTIYTGAPNDIIDPLTGDVLGRLDEFYLSGAIRTSVSPVTLTVELGASTDNTAGTIGACV